jgi:uncharacterized low-complexity protein
MSNKSTLKPVAAVVGAGLLVSAAISPIANAAENPFSANILSNGYMVSQAADAAAPDAKEGEKKAEGACGEGKCGEGKCGDMKAAEGKDADKKKAEGTCGEGKCGAAMGM